MQRYMYTLIFNTQILIIPLSEEHTFSQNHVRLQLGMVNITVLQLQLELFQSNTKQYPSSVYLQSVHICKSDF